MSEEARGGGKDSFKVARWGRPLFNSSQQLLLWTFLSGKQVPVPSWSTTYSDLMMLSDTGPAFLSDKICTLENQVHSSFCPRRAPVGSGCHLSPHEVCRKWSPTRTGSLHHYSEQQCKIKDAEGCWKTNFWVKMEKFYQEIRFLCFFPVLC